MSLEAGGSLLPASPQPHRMRRQYFAVIYRFAAEPFFASAIISSTFVFPS